ncbi:uncharacterized protein AB675_10812 [Cyphellophora attinorum]|uniref:Uncharacterized protein n=1 Tax=Cyphellophora attinorum TaxID=1664694 RepID=A0A0N1H573_9EURO|nr:uncharacterized protein AB675_10812 [Phialophora attinorum]KPI40777.1 hypothetical protein AB675_10812 [Phialophora attinorum]
MSIDDRSNRFEEPTAQHHPTSPVPFKPPTMQLIYLINFFSQLLPLSLLIANTLRPRLPTQQLPIQATESQQRSTLDDLPIPQPSSSFVVHAYAPQGPPEYLRSPSNTPIPAHPPPLTAPPDHRYQACLPKVYLGQLPQQPQAHSTTSLLTAQALPLVIIWVIYFVFLPIAVAFLLQRWALVPETLPVGMHQRDPGGEGKLPVGRLKSPEGDGRKETGSRAPQQQPDKPGTSGPRNSNAGSGIEQGRIWNKRSGMVFATGRGVLGRPRGGDKGLPSRATTTSPTAPAAKDTHKRMNPGDDVHIHLALFPVPAFFAEGGDGAGKGGHGAGRHSGDDDIMDLDQPPTPPPKPKKRKNRRYRGKPHPSPNNRGSPSHAGPSLPVNWTPFFDKPYHSASSHSSGSYWSKEDGWPPTSPDPPSTPSLTYHDPQVPLPEPDDALGAFILHNDPPPTHHLRRETRKIRDETYECPRTYYAEDWMSAKNRAAAAKGKGRERMSVAEKEAKMRLGSWKNIFTGQGSRAAERAREEGVARERAEEERVRTMRAVLAERRDGREDSAVKDEDENEEMSLDGVEDSENEKGFDGGEEAESDDEGRRRGDEMEVDDSRGQEDVAGPSLRYRGRKRKAQEDDADEQPQAATNESRMSKVRKMWRAKLAAKELRRFVE